ncbi:MAG: radical SAM protein [Thermoanaerobaculia bacterium]
MPRRLLPWVDDRFVVTDFEPAYLATWRAGMLESRVGQALPELADCRVCPRNCGVNRLADETGACHTGRYAIVSSAFPHFGEEDCLRGWNGSGTIFFALCNLRCSFCQNWDISQRKMGQEMDAGQITGVMLELQDRGCHNINFVTPEHVAPQVVEAIGAAVPRGLRVPIVYNTSAYDSFASLRLMDGLVDIYMPDFKFWSSEVSFRFALAKDYAERAREAIAEMHRQVGPLRFGRDGLARRGVLIRHLVMPGQLEEAKAIFRWIASELSPDTYVNIMGQYRPEHQVGQIGRDGRPKFEEINRRVEAPEVEAAFAAAREAGLWRFDQRAPLPWLSMSA